MKASVCGPRGGLWALFVNEAPRNSLLGSPGSRILCSGASAAASVAAVGARGYPEQLSRWRRHLRLGRASRCGHLGAGWGRRQRQERWRGLLRGSRGGRRRERGRRVGPGLLRLSRGHIRRLRQRLPSPQRRSRARRPERPRAVGEGFSELVGARGHGRGP